MLFKEADQVPEGEEQGEIITQQQSDVYKCGM